MKLALAHRRPKTHRHRPPPLILAIFAFSAYCLSVLIRNDAQRLPKWAWAILIVISQPLGGIAYLALGRRDR